MLKLKRARCIEYTFLATFHKVAYGGARASTGNGRSWQRVEKRKSTGVEGPREGRV